MKFNFQLNFKLRYTGLRYGAMVIFLLAMVFFVQALVPTAKASAAAYNYTSYLMDDSTFRAPFTMSASDIQTFLQNKGSGLASFVDTEACGSDARGAMMAQYSSYFSCGTQQKASQIIYDTAQAYGINPQVLLATMQKEQSLVTTPNPTASQLNFAMGYGCPDSGSCSYPGFFTQVAWAAWQFRYDFEAIYGNNYGGYTPASYPCNGATKYYSTALKTGNNVTFSDDYGTAYANFTLPNASTSALYCYTPHVFPGSSQEYFSGSYNFVYYFSLWFGSTTTPYAFKSPTSGGVYLFINGYKVAVPSMAMLQDYGINPGAIQTLSQATVDSISTPSVSANGISPVLSSLVKATNDSRIFLVSVGKKSTITSMDQFYGFSFNTANISYLPLGFIASINGSGYLQDYLQNPHNTVFQINAGNKRIIFDGPTYNTLNPSGAFTPVSDSISTSIPSGSPIVNREVLIKNNAGSVFLLVNGAYYGLPSLDIYNCWGFTTALKTPLYPLVYDSDIASMNGPTNLTSCLVNNSQGTTYLLNNSNKYAVPASFGSFSGTITPNQDVIGLVSRIPSASSSLSQAVKSSSADVVWYLENGVKKAIPSLSTLNQLGIGSGQVPTLGDYSLNSVQASGLKLADGQIVKSSSDAGVYMVSGNNRVLFSSGDDFSAYHFSGSDIQTISSTDLDQNYPFNGVIVQKYIYNFANNTAYIADSNGCFSFTANVLSSYGKTASAIISAQNYSNGLFRHLNLSQCLPASTYVRNSGSNVVYWIDGGTKYAFSSWNALVAKSGSSNPYIITLSNSSLATFPTGSSL